MPYGIYERTLMQNRPLSELLLSRTGVYDLIGIICRVRIHHLDVNESPQMASTPATLSSRRSWLSTQTNSDMHTIEALYRTQ